MLFSVAAHLVEASQNKLIGERDFFCFLLLTHKKILIAEFLKSKFSTVCLLSEINCKAQKSSDTRKVVFVALETRQISSIKPPLIQELSIIKLILNRYEQWIQYRHICEKGPKAEHQKLAKMCKRNVQYPTETR